MILEGSTVNLLEVILSLLLLSLTMLGVSAMQLSSLQHLQASQNLIAASELLSSLDNYLQNTKGINTDNFVEKWKLHVREMLPLGTGEMHGSFPDYTLNVYWGGTNASTCIPPKAGKHGCLSQRRNTIWRHLA